MTYQAQVVINGTTIYNLMLRPETLAITGTTEYRCIPGTTCFYIYYWHHILLDVILALYVPTYIIGTTFYWTYYWHYRMHVYYWHYMLQYILLAPHLMQHISLAPHLMQYNFTGNIFLKKITTTS